MRYVRPDFFGRLRKWRARPGDKWHCDEMLLKIKGKRYWLWRAVDHDGSVLDILVQERRDQAAAEACLQRVLASCEGMAPRVIVTHKRVLPTTEHRRHKSLNNRAENSHLPVRKRERTLQRFKSKEHAERFLGPFSLVGNCFRPRRHRLSANQYRHVRHERSLLWREVTLGNVRP